MAGFWILRSQSFLIWSCHWSFWSFIIVYQENCSNSTLYTRSPCVQASWSCPNRALGLNLCSLAKNIESQVITCDVGLHITKFSISKLRELLDLPASPPISNIFSYSHGYVNNMCEYSTKLFCFGTELYLYLIELCLNLVLKQWGVAWHIVRRTNVNLPWNE